MPFNSSTNDSELTRTSILSEATERPASRHSEDTRTPVKEVSRFSISAHGTPSPQTPIQNTTRQTQTSHSNNLSAEQSPIGQSSPQSISSKARIAALSAAGLRGVEDGKNTDEDERPEENGSPSTHRLASPVSPASPAQSVSSLRQRFDQTLIPQGLRPKSGTSFASPGAERLSVYSDLSESSVKDLEHELDEHLRPQSDLTYDDPGTPRGEDMEEWFQRGHEENERYRQSMVDSNLSDDVSDRRHTRYTDDTYSSETSPERNVRGVANQPQYIHSPHGVESAVASLLEPSMVSDSTGTGASLKYERFDNHDHRAAEDTVDIKDHPPATHKAGVFTASDEDAPLKTRWSQLRERAEGLSSKNSPNGRIVATSPLQSDSPSQRERRSLRSESPVKLGASGMPLLDDPMPEIGHGLDDVSEVSTNPPEIQGVKAKGHKDRWSYDTNGFLKESRESLSQQSGRGGANPLIADGAAAAGLAAGHALAEKDHSVSPRHLSHRSSLDDGYSRDSSPAIHQAEAVYMDRANAPSASPAFQHGDEGYSSAAYARSPIGASAKGKHAEYTKEQLNDYAAAMGADNDVFTHDGKKKHARHFSANSHALTSPPYDSATGNGIDRIQSEDVVALMDHLTVRDAQRNARDTEILVTLVRSAAEMRQEFDAMKKFIAEQDRMIMQNTDRDAEITVQKVLSGPRPMPGGSAMTRSPRTSYDSEEFATKRKNIFQRALKGLSKGKNNDMERIEDLLHQLLGDVENLKVSQGTGRQSMSIRSNSMDSYDVKYHTAPDSGYEPEGQAGTSSTPNQSGTLDLTPTREKHFHSGYDGRRGSVNRVSTVMEEGDEDRSTLNDREERLLDNQFEGNERLLTPTQETYNRRSGSFDTSPRSDRDRTPEPDKQYKHKSTNSSIFGMPKFSRWSKTTSSTDPDYKRKSDQSYQSYQSGDSLDNAGYYGQNYAVQSDDRLRSTQSLAREQVQQAEADSMRSTQSSELTRTPSPLMPSENGSYLSKMEPFMTGGAGDVSPLPQLRQENLDHLNEDEMDAASFEDPKYQAHRNSLLLQHPQPRPGPTHRHQTNLENEARTFSGEKDVPPSGLTDSDLSQKTDASDFDPAQWGSAPALSLPRMQKAVKDDGPLFPQPKTGPSSQQIQREKEEAARKEADAKEKAQRAEQNRNDKPRHAYDRMYYSSPLGNGHLLEPIPEVRYSLETDSGHVSCLHYLLLQASY